MRQKESSMSWVTAALLVELGRKKSAISYQKLVASLTNRDISSLFVYTYW